MTPKKLSATIKAYPEAYKTALIAAGALLTGIATTVLVQKKEDSKYVHLHFDKSYVPNLSRGLGKIGWTVDGVDYYLSTYNPK